MVRHDGERGSAGVGNETGCLVFPGGVPKTNACFLYRGFAVKCPWSRRETKVGFIGWDNGVIYGWASVDTLCPAPFVVIEAFVPSSSLENNKHKAKFPFVSSQQGFNLAYRLMAPSQQ
jgi:hypothetical protein